MDWFDEKVFDPENQKIITERIEQSVNTLKELSKGIGNRIMFGFFAVFPLLEVMVIRHNAEVFTWWNAVTIIPLLFMGGVSVSYFSLLQESKSRMSQKEWLNFGARVDFLKAASWTAIIIFLGIMNEVPARTFYVFGGILFLGVIFVFLEGRQFQFFIKYLDELEKRKKKLSNGKD